MKYPSRPIAVVESEKTAVIGSICKGIFPDMIWIACGGKSNFKTESLERLAGNRKVVIYPDADSFEKWREIASDARKRGLAVSVSDLIERLATGDQKADGLDLADCLIIEQQKRNDPAIREAFRDLIEERLAIMIDGGMSEQDAETQILASGFYQRTLRNVLPI